MWHVGEAVTFGPRCTEERLRKSPVLGVAICHFRVSDSLLLFLAKETMPMY